MSGIELESRSYRFGDHAFDVTARDGLLLTVSGYGKDGDIVDDEPGAELIDAAARSVEGVERTWTTVWSVADDAALAAMVRGLGDARIVAQSFTVDVDRAAPLWELFTGELLEDPATQAAHSYWTWRKTPQGPLQVAMEMESGPEGRRFHATGYDFMARYSDCSDHPIFEEVLARIAGGAPRTPEGRPRLRRAGLTAPQHDALARALMEIPGLYDVSLRVTYG